jgi:myo-inositol 2-dehydrogenase / D-chiro-inositol 1-dehydrogenase
MNRRKFLQGASTACSLMIVKPSVAFSYAANSAVQYGLLGCGKRGTSVATSFATNTQARVVALGDIFSDQLAIGKQHFDQLNLKLGVPAVDPKLTFHGWEAYKAMAANPHIDAVQISTPPFFHVEHMDILSAGGKHVYCEKPVGVDIPQTRRALQIAKRIDGKVSASVGFQIRSAPPFAEIVQRIHAGQIGKIASIAGYYNAPPATYPDRGAMPHDEQRLRNWLWDKTLSGDILLEQNIHVIDVCNWVMGSHPLKATARASRKVIQNFGNINDNYEVIFEYPGEVELVFSSTQFNAPGYFDVKETFFGTEGIAEMPYKGALRIQGQKPWTWTGSEQESGAKFAADGAFSDNLADADKMKDRSFIESITGNKFQNQIAAGVESARTCMMARKSAETGRTVSWQDIEADTEQYQLGIEIRKFV